MATKGLLSKCDSISFRPFTRPPVRENLRRYAGKCGRSDVIQPLDITIALQAVLQEHLSPDQAAMIAQQQTHRLVNQWRGDRFYFSSRSLLAWRDEAICRALKTEPVAIVAARYKLSRSRIYQIKKLQFFG